MDEILKIDTIDRYNKLFGFETRHPLVGVVRFDTAESQGNYRMTMGFYSVFLKETRGCRINYGKTGYDFDDQTVVSIAPGQTVGYTDIEGIPTKSVGLLFHPDFIRGTSLGRKIRKYTFFSYEANEALHLSEEERTIVLDCLKKIEMELRHAIDKHSKGLIATNQFDAGYLSIVKAVEAIEKRGDREQIVLESYYIEKEDLQKTHFEKILYPIE